MSISFPATDSPSSLEQIRATRAQHGTRVTSQARVEANRKNCLQSTGPTTSAGKRRASRNAMKHGLCRTLSCLPSECEATFLTFVAELEQELRPATALQRITFNQIASLTWRLERLPEAQTKLFAEELAKVGSYDWDGGAAADGEELKPSDVLARRFSDEPGSNGFALLERYERGMRSQLLRLMRHYDQLQKRRPTTPYDPDEPPCPSEGSKPAWTEEKAQAQRAWFAEQERLHAQGKQPDPEWLRLREIHQRQLAEAKGRAAEKAKPGWFELRQEHLRREAEEEAREAASSTAATPAPSSTPASTAVQSVSAGPRRSEREVVCEEETARGGAGALPRRGGEEPRDQSRDARPKRSQSKPTQNLELDAPEGKCSIPDASPVTKRSQPAARDATPMPAARGNLQSPLDPPMLDSARGGHDIVTITRQTETECAEF
ncbi:MAG: hypothetical protein WBD40_05305 [Tepidisphaeraceae bacterium]